MPKLAPARERGLILMPKLVPRVAAGNKTETRRLIRFPASPEAHRLRRIVPPHSMTLRDGRWIASWPFPDVGAGTALSFEKPVFCPFGIVGDRLYVRERHQFKTARSTGGRIRITVEYSDGAKRTIKLTFEQWEKMGRKARLNRPRPSIHMHRWASRYVLEIVGIEAERVGAVDELTALSEGCEGRKEEGVLNGVRGQYTMGSALEEFIEIWDGLHPKDPFASNPWVWVVKFKRVA